jgi:hypothetical protein
MPTRAQKRLAVALLVIVGVVFLTIAAGGILLFRRYITTEYVHATRAAQVFAEERAHLAGQVPLMQYQGFDGVVRREPSRPRRELRTLYALAYSASDGELKRARIPWWLVRSTTLGGRVALANMVMFGDDSTRVTIEDLERHGPGLVVDTSGAAVGPLAVSDAVFGTRTMGSGLLIWTE